MEDRQSVSLIDAEIRKPSRPNTARRRSAHLAISLSILAVAGIQVASYVSSIFSVESDVTIAPYPAAALSQPYPADVLFVVGPECSKPRSKGRTALAAAKKKNAPPPKKTWGVVTPEVDPNKVWTGAEMPGYESKDEQYDRVARQAIWLKSLIPKLVPLGAKPWDPHQFIQSDVIVRLEAKQAANSKIMNQVIEELRRITGVHPTIIRSTVDDSKLGWRKNAPAGAMAQVKGRLNQDFVNRLNTVVLPRVRDFEGLYPNDFTMKGDFYMTIKSQEPFAEVDDMIDGRLLTHSFVVQIKNNCMTQPDGLALMKNFGFPFGEPRPYSEPPPKKVARKNRYIKVKERPAR